MKCDFCNSEETYIKDYENKYVIKGKNIEFISKRRFCKKCNNLVYDDQLDNKVSEIAIDIYNKKYGISKDDIISLRNKYNLSQDLFSKVIGCAKKTLISYEKGKSIPNDSYLIILKTLIAKPNTIFILVNANKEQFTDKELLKINNRIEKCDIIKSDLTELENFDEYNGYTKYSKDKLYNTILFFSEGSVLKTKLLKEMFYADFLSYKEIGKSITGLEYVKLPFGPVPNDYENILNNFSNQNIINYSVNFLNDYEYNIISAKKKFNKNIFEKEEIEILNKVKEKFVSYGSKDIVNYSHKEEAFLKTKPLDRISYDYAFDINF